ncbi:MAG: Asp-tRNA(Asn)/Glu-tRNA(Gln) amidotransferase subunit GatC [Candidatus Tectomicrobia bacterium]|nr:Asp-tRNA(Asn)/Glu-tRNA(Gln) amidotransferase subunit GatC [Candidatus Tectomicrobia bacterium]
MKLTREQVEHVAELARLKFSGEELERFREQLGNILTYIDVLNEVDTEGIEPVTTVLPMQNVFREDEVKHPLPQEDFLALAPSAERGHYKVPKIIE